MTYELAEKLKTAGFPQSGKGTHFMDPACGPDADDDCMRDGHSSYFPTLEELIAACVDNFKMLQRAEIYKTAGYGKDAPKRREGIGWFAFPCSNDIMAQGDTPIEAVGNLWLVLNKK